MSERCPISPSEDISLSLRFLRRQFPIRLIFAMTVNNTPRQLYVALSSCSTQYNMGLIKTDYNFYIINIFYTRACHMKHSSGSTKQIFLSQLEASSLLHLWPVTQLQTNINLCPLIHMDKRKIKSLINHTSEEQNL